MTTTDPRRKVGTRSDALGPDGRAGLVVSGSVVALLLTLGVAVGMQGAFYRPGQGVLAAGLAVAIAASVVAARPHVAELRRVPVPALGALAAGILVAAAVHGDAADGVPGASLALAVAAVLLLVRRAGDDDRAFLLAALPVLGALAAAGAWLGLVLRLPRWSLEAQDVWRASGTLTYPNATAALLVVLALLAIGVAAAGHAPLVPARVQRLLATLMLAAALGTLSRGGLVALLVGIAALGMAGGRRMLAAAAGPLAGAVVAFAGLLPSLAGDVPVRVPVAVAALAAGLCVCELVAGRTPAAAEVRSSRRGAVAVAVILLAIVAVAVGVALVAARPILGTVADVRVIASSMNRVPAAAAGLRLWREDPVLGVGPGNAQVSWRDADGADRTALYLHDEYLQVLVEDGVVGGALLLAVMAGCVVAARSGRRAVAAARAQPRAVRAGGAAALAAFAVHSALDFLWHIPVLPLVAAAVLGVALAGPPAQAGAGPPIPTSAGGGGGGTD